MALNEEDRRTILHIIWMAGAAIILLMIIFWMLVALVQD